MMAAMVMTAVSLLGLLKRGESLLRAGYVAVSQRLPI